MKDACIWADHISQNPGDYYRKRVPLHECLTLCSMKYPLCKSIDYSDHGQCFLNKKSTAEVDATPFCNNFSREAWTLLEISCSCKNKPVMAS